MRRVLQTLVVLALLGLLGAGAVVGVGLYNVSARMGHLPGVAWLLHTTYENSVALRAPPESAVPELDDPDLVALGARHFDAACRMCHAAPGAIRSETVRAMEPTPPHITDAVAGWQPRHLHWIVFEGVKMSGMPGWPADRPEEVWALVAFLEALPGMTPERYRALTAAPEAAEDPLVAYCATCHGVDGAAANPRIPRLDIQGETYLRDALQAYHADLRASGIMAHAASEAGPAAFDRLARHYAALPPGKAFAEPPAGLVERGRVLAQGTTGDDDVPACAACHGSAPSRGSAHFPSLAGQHRAYLEAQLHLWHEGARGGGPRSELMHEAAQDLTAEEIAALAAYYASLPPAKRAATAPDAR